MCLVLPCHRPMCPVLPSSCASSLAIVLCICPAGLGRSSPILEGPLQFSCSLEGCPSCVSSPCLSRRPGGPFPRLSLNGRSSSAFPWRVSSSVPWRAGPAASVVPVCSGCPGGPRQLSLSVPGALEGRVNYPCLFPAPRRAASVPSALEGLVCVPGVLPFNKTCSPLHLCVLACIRVLSLPSRDTPPLGPGCSVTGGGDRTRMQARTQRWSGEQVLLQGEGEHTRNTDETLQGTGNRRGPPGRQEQTGTTDAPLQGAGNRQGQLRQLGRPSKEQKTPSKEKLNWSGPSTTGLDTALQGAGNRQGQLTQLGRPSGEQKK